MVIVVLNDIVIVFGIIKNKRFDDVRVIVNVGVFLIFGEVVSNV